MNSTHAILNQVTNLLQSYSNKASASDRISSGHVFPASYAHTKHRCDSSCLPKCTDLSSLKGQHILFISDSENLSYSYRKEGLDLDYGSLLSSVRAVAKQVEPFAFATVADGQPLQYAEQYFKSCGWLPMISPARQNFGRMEANSDAVILINTGRLLSNTKANVLLIGSGDGELGATIAEFAQSLPNPPRIITLSRSGSLSGRLKAGRNPHITANISLGSDHVKPINHH